MAHRKQHGPREGFGPAAIIISPEKSKIFQIQRHLFRLTATSSSLTLNAGKHQSFKKYFRSQLLASSGDWQFLSQTTPTTKPNLFMKGVIIHISRLLGDYSVQCLLSFLVAWSFHFSPVTASLSFFPSLLYL